MSVFTHCERIQSEGECDVHDVTSLADKALQSSKLHAGILNIIVPGSTAGVTTIEFEPGAVGDLKSAIERLAPR